MLARQAVSGVVENKRGVKKRADRNLDQDNRPGSRSRLNFYLDSIILTDRRRYPPFYPLAYNTASLRRHRLVMQFKMISRLIFSSCLPLLRPSPKSSIMPAPHRHALLSSFCFPVSVSFFLFFFWGFYIYIYILYSFYTAPPATVQRQYCHADWK